MSLINTRYRRAPLAPDSASLCSGRPLRGCPISVAAHIQSSALGCSCPALRFGRDAFGRRVSPRRPQRAKASGCPATSPPQRASRSGNSKRCSYRLFSSAPLARFLRTARPISFSWTCNDFVPVFWERYSPSRGETMGFDRYGRDARAPSSSGMWV